MRIFLSLTLLSCSLFLLEACTADALAEPIALPCDGVAPTYEGEVREIIERTCAYSGCHLGGSNGSYDSYQGILSDLESGQFRQRVISRKDDPNLGMPPNYAPDGREEDLTQEDLMTITCWIDGGYPEQ